MNKKNRKKSSLSQQKKTTKQTGTPRAHRQIKLQARLNKQQKSKLPQSALDAKGGLILYGWHPVMAALANPQRKIHHLFVSEQAHRKMAKILSNKQPETTILSREQFDQLLNSEGKQPPVHQGIALSTSMLISPILEDILAIQNPDKHCRLLILDQLSDPRNIGAILRSAQAFGANAVIMTSRHAPTESGALAKAAAGALEHIPIITVTNLARVLTTIHEHQISLIGLSANGTARLEDFSNTKRLGLILGSEGDGLRRLTTTKCDYLASIPIATDCESLNVSVAAAIALYATQIKTID